MSAMARREPQRPERPDEVLDEADVEAAVSDEAPEASEWPPFPDVPDHRPPPDSVEEFEEWIEGPAVAEEEISLHVEEDLVEAVLDEGPPLAGFEESDVEVALDEHAEDAESP